MVRGLPPTKSMGGPIALKELSIQTKATLLVLMSAVAVASMPKGEHC